MFLNNFLQCQLMSYKASRNYACVNYSGSTVNADTQQASNRQYLDPTYEGTSSSGRHIAGSLFFLSNDSLVYHGNASESSYPTCWGVILGDGNTPPTKTDYRLSGNIITGFSASTAVGYNVANGVLTVTGTYVITNTSGSEFTIREIGLSRAQTDSGASRILLTRDVLDVPVTIAPNETKTIIYQLAMGS